VYPSHACSFFDERVTPALLQAVWPPLLKTLLQILESDQHDSAQAALTTFQLLCEDHIDKLCTSSDMNEILNMMISRFISLFSSPDAEIRRIAINCSRQFILPLPNAFLVNLNPFLQVSHLVLIASLPELVSDLTCPRQGLLSLSKDQSAGVRKEICQVHCNRSGAARSLPA
jgi:hypothetical protein